MHQAQSGSSPCIANRSALYYSCNDPTRSSHGSNGTYRSKMQESDLSLHRWQAPRSISMQRLFLALHRVHLSETCAVSLVCSWQKEKTDDVQSVSTKAGRLIGWLAGRLAGWLAFERGRKVELGKPTLWGPSCGSRQPHAACAGDVQPLTCP